MEDSSIFLSGYADAGLSATKTDYGYGFTDYWVVHFKYGASSTGLNEISNSPISAFPNPSNNQVTFSSDKNLSGKILSIRDLTGKLIESSPFYNGLKLDIRKFADGMYLYEINNEKGIKYVGKILKY